MFSIRIVASLQYAAALALLGHGLAQDAEESKASTVCMPQCFDQPCIYLNGNLQVECGVCTPESGAVCFPGQEGYDTWESRKGSEIKGIIREKPIVCESHCKENQCESLNGNLTIECGACCTDALCYPGSEHYDDWQVRSKTKGEL